jgi:hypothetical protein
MKKTFLLMIVFLIGLFSLLSFFIILNYLDPYQNIIFALILISITFILSVSSFLTILLFFIKKIHYRGEVELFHIKTSFRQSFFIGLFLIWLIILNYINAPLFILGTLLFLIFALIELFIENLES